MERKVLTILRCEEGGLHALVYRGKGHQSYWCTSCGVIIDKVDLKRETD